jgi:hypothetical protein
VEFPTTGGETAFGLFYPPRNPDYAPSAEERPPLPGHDQRRPAHHVEAGGLEGKPVLWPEPLAKAK